VPGLYGTAEARERLREKHTRLRPEYQRGQRLTIQSTTTKNTQDWEARRNRYRDLRRDGFKRSRVVTMLFDEQSDIKLRGNFTRRLGIAALEKSLRAKK